MKIRIPPEKVLSYIKNNFSYQDGLLRNGKRVFTKEFQMIIEKTEDGLHLMYYAKHSQIVWFLVHGFWAQQIIDHIDGNPKNNQVENLRLANRAQNSANSRKPNIQSTSRYKGVYWNRGRWYARIAGKHLGCFFSEEIAAKAYDKAALELYGEYAKGNFI